MFDKGLSICIYYFTKIEEESRHTHIFHDEMFDNFVTVKLYKEFGMFKFSSLKEIYVNESNRNSIEAENRCTELKRMCDESRKPFYFKDSYLNNTINVNEKIDLELDTYCNLLGKK